VVLQGDNCARILRRLSTERNLASSSIWWVELRGELAKSLKPGGSIVVYALQVGSSAVPPEPHLRGLISTDSGSSIGYETRPA